MMQYQHCPQNIMIRSLQLLKNGFRGLTSSSSSEQSSSQESKPAQSLLKNHIISRVMEVTSEMTERPIIISVLRQALDGITDTSLLGFVKLCRREFDDIIVKFNYLHESQSEGF